MFKWILIAIIVVGAAYHFYPTQTENARKQAFDKTYRAGRELAR